MAACVMLLDYWIQELPEVYGGQDREDVRGRDPTCAPLSCMHSAIHVCDWCAKKFGSGARAVELKTARAL